MLGAFQPPLSNAWLWYSSWNPLKHTRPGSTQALSPTRPPLKTGGGGLWARVPGSLTTSMKLPRAAGSKAGPQRNIQLLIFSECGED